MDFYYIALPSEYDRRANIEKWLASTTFQYSWVCAKKGSDDVNHSYCERERIKRFGFPMSEPEIGCFLSHKECWQYVVASNKTSVVLESDAVPLDLDSLVELIKIIEKPEMESRYDLIRLAGVFPDNEKFPRTVACLGASRLLQFHGDPMGAAAYVVTPSAARKLIECSRRFFLPVDVYLGLTWLHRLRVRTIRPYPIQALSFDSVIGERRRPKQTRSERLRIELNRASDDFKRLMYIPFHYFR